LKFETEQYVCDNPQCKKTALPKEAQHNWYFFYLGFKKDNGDTSWKHYYCCCEECLPKSKPFGLTPENPFYSAPMKWKLPEERYSFRGSFGVVGGNRKKVNYLELWDKKMKKVMK